MTAHEFRDLVDTNFESAFEKVQYRNYIDVCLLIRVKIDDYQMKEKSRDTPIDEILNNLPMKFYAIRSLLDQVNPH